MSGLALRRAGAADAPALAALHRRARRLAWPWIAHAHSPADDLAFFAERVLPACTVWAGERDGRLAGFCAVRTGWIDHLFVAPEAQGRGVGGALLAAALARRRRVRLWTFQRNTRARAFYARYRFAELRHTDGRANEEREPDVLLEWRAPQFRG